MNIYAARITKLNEDGTPGETVVFDRLATVELWLVGDPGSSQVYGYVRTPTEREQQTPVGWTAADQRKSFETFDRTMKVMGEDGRVDVQVKCRDHCWDAREYYDVCLNCDERREPIVESEDK